MEILLTVMEHYSYPVTLKASYVNESIFWEATIEETPLLSYFDHTEKYIGNTIEEALEKMSMGIEKSINAAKEW